jgi:predicted component of type VI protein secretion system
LQARKHQPDLTISDESAAEMVAALIFALSDGKPHKIARRVAVMRKVLETRAAEQKVVALRSPLCPQGTKARAGEAAARMERVEIILKEIARL